MGPKPDPAVQEEKKEGRVKKKKGVELRPAGIYFVPVVTGSSHLFLLKNTTPLSINLHSPTLGENGLVFQQIWSLFHQPKSALFACVTWSGCA